jgi:hypothetical protein
MAKRACEIIRARPFSAQPETTWREAVSDKTAALDARMKGADERLASVQKAMEVNKEVIDKTMSAAVGSIKTDVEKAVGGMEKAVGGIKMDVEKAVGGIKTDVVSIKSDMEKIVTDKVASMEKVLKAEVSAVKDSFRGLERLFILAVAVFIFGKPVLGGINDVFNAAKEGVSSKESSS